jgi:hypothetical protein
MAGGGGRLGLGWRRRGGSCSRGDKTAENPSGERGCVIYKAKPLGIFVLVLLSRDVLWFSRVLPVQSCTIDPTISKIAISPLEKLVHRRKRGE